MEDDVLAAPQPPPPRSAASAAAAAPDVPPSGLRERLAGRLRVEPDAIDGWMLATNLSRTGFDTGNAASPGNTEFREQNNAGLPSRVAYAIISPGSSGITSPNGVDGHGNINCSIVGGFNNGTGTPDNDRVESRVVAELAGPSNPVQWRPEPWRPGWPTLSQLWQDNPDGSVTVTLALVKQEGPFLAEARWSEISGHLLTTAAVRPG